MKKQINGRERRHRKIVWLRILFALYTAFIFIVSYVLLAVVFTILKDAYGIDITYNQHRFLFWSILLLCCGVTGSMSFYFLGGPLLEDIAALSEAAGQIREGNFRVRVQQKKWLFKQKSLLEDFIEDFNQMAQELEGVEILRSGFVNNFSHEFKTPIVSIKGFAEELSKDDLSPAEREEYLAIIIREADRLSRLSTNILNLSKIEQQSILTNRVRYNVGEQLRQAVLLEMSAIEKENIALDINISDCYVSGDEGLLEQVWINVLDNSLKFMEDGGLIAVQVRQEGDRVRVVIKDSGCGISEEDMLHVFEKFYRADSQNKYAGNGLGLALAKKIVDLHQGDISVKSREGEGTTVTVELPVDYSI